MTDRSLSRRGFLGLGAAGAGLLGLGGAGRALAAAPNDRKFLFVYATGGWDHTYCFAPVFDNPNVDMEGDATAALVNGIPFVDSARRPAVRAFFETWGDRACVVNGMEVRSISHTRARRLLFTGSAQETGDDWGSVLAANASSFLTLPYLVASGPAFNTRYAGESVRLGLDGQLSGLLDGSALVRSDLVVTPPSPSTEVAIDTFVRARSTARVAAAGRGAEAAMAGSYDAALTRLDTLKSLRGTLQIPAAGSPATLAGLIFDGMELGLTRCGVVEHAGWQSLGFDSHAGNARQSDHFQLLFADLGVMLADLADRTAPDGTPLADQVTIVVFSELGRHPQLNSDGGKDHWTYTSAMVVGAGVRGGQVIGAFDDTMYGVPVDLVSGEPSDAGTALVTGHLGATLLAMADVDPGDYVPDAAPIAAMIA